MIIQLDHVAVQGFSWMMPCLIVQGDHVAVQGFIIDDAMNVYRR